MACAVLPATPLVTVLTNVYFPDKPPSVMFDGTLSFT